MRIRIDFPFMADFDFENPGSNSRELRTQALQDYLQTCGMELGAMVDSYSVVSFQSEEGGEYWQVKEGR